MYYVTIWIIMIKNSKEIQCVCEIKKNNLEYLNRCLAFMSKYNLS